MIKFCSGDSYVGTSEAGFGLSEPHDRVGCPEFWQLHAQAAGATLMFGIGTDCIAAATACWICRLIACSMWWPGTEWENKATTQLEVADW
jgi:hypothetical protein